MSGPINRNRSSSGALVPTFPEYHFDVTTDELIEPPAVIYVTLAGAYDIFDVAGNKVTWTLPAGGCAPVMASRVGPDSDHTTGIIGVRQWPTPITE